MVKRTDKYEWLVGSRPPPIDPHSIVKHRIVRSYLERYIHVLMSNYMIDKLTLSIVDGFAGGGEYSADNVAQFHDGSPLIVVNTVVEQEAILNIGREKPRKVDAKYYFVEKSPANFEYLKTLLGARLPASRIGNDVLLFQEPFHNVVATIIADIRKRAGGERAIFILDQYAYDQVPTPLLRQIFENLKGAEVILTFNVDSLISFLSDSKQSRAKLTEMGLAQYIDWTTIQSLKASDANAWRAAIQRDLAFGLVNGSGARHHTIFYITPVGASTWTYWLVHLSNNYKARDVMMELHWQLANHFSHYLAPDLFTLGYRANNDTKATGQNAMDFGEAHHFDVLAATQCKNGLAEKLVPLIHNWTGARAFGHLLDEIGSYTPATAEMIREALDPAIQTREVIATAVDGATRTKGSSLKATDILNASPQITFLPINRKN